MSSAPSVSSVSMASSCFQVILGWKLKTSFKHSVNYVQESNKAASHKEIQSNHVSDKKESRGEILSWVSGGDSS